MYVQWNRSFRKRLPEESALHDSSIFIGPLVGLFTEIGGISSVCLSGRGHPRNADKIRVGNFTLLTCVVTRLTGAVSSPLMQPPASANVSTDVVAKNSR